jgi:hypothetical protein
MMLSDRAKGKQRAIDPHLASGEVAPVVESSVDSTRDLVIRFTEGIPDLVVAVDQQDSVWDVKRKVRPQISYFGLSADLAT